MFEILEKTKDTAVATHFIQPNNTTQDIVITSIYLFFKSDSYKTQKTILDEQNLPIGRNEH